MCYTSAYVIYEWYLINGLSLSPFFVSFGLFLLFVFFGLLFIWGPGQTLWRANTNLFWSSDYLRSDQGLVVRAWITAIKVGRLAKIGRPIILGFLTFFSKKSKNIDNFFLTFYYFPMDFILVLQPFRSFKISSDIFELVT